MTRYCYHDQLSQRNPVHGLFCDPVKNDSGKCICNAWSMLVRFEDGSMQVVGNRRALRLRYKCKRHNSPKRKEHENGQGRESSHQTV